MDPPKKRKSTSKKKSRMGRVTPVTPVDLPSDPVSIAIQARIAGKHRHLEILQKNIERTIHLAKDKEEADGFFKIFQRELESEISNDIKLYRSRVKKMFQDMRQRFIKDVTKYTDYLAETSAALNERLRQATSTLGEEYSRLQALREALQAQLESLRYLQALKEEQAETIVQLKKELDQVRENQVEEAQRIRLRHAHIQIFHTKTQHYSVTSVADPMTNGGWDDEDEEPNWPPPPPRTVLSSGPSGVTRVEIGGSNNASTDNNPSLVPRHGHTHHNRGHETDAEVLERVSQIISQIDWTVDLVRRPDSIRPNSSRMRAAREDLISGAKRFVTASKALVKSATIMMSDSQGAAAVMEASEAPRNPGWTPGGNPGGNPGGGSARPTSLTGHKHMLFHESLVRCTDLVGMMFASAAEVAHCSPTAADAAKLVEGILLVAVAFRATVQAAFRPSRPGTVEQENSLHDPAVKVLMSEATKLAASLTTLMKTIRSLEGSSSAGMQNGDGPPTAAAAVMFGGEPHQQPQLHSKNAHQVVAMI